MPTEHRAFHADGEFGNIFQRLRVFELFEGCVVRDVSANHIEKEMHEAKRVVDRAAAKELGHDGGGGLADGAAVSRIGEVFNLPVFQKNFNREIVAAIGIVTVLGKRRASHFPFIRRVFVVFQNQIGVELLQIHGDSLLNIRRPLSVNREPCVSSYRTHQM